MDEALRGWARVSLDLMRESVRSSRAIMLYDHLPDGIVSAAIIREILERWGVEVKSIPVMSEEILPTVENNLDQGASLVLVGIAPTGPGPLSVAKEIYASVVLIDDFVSDHLDRSGVVRIKSEFPLPLAAYYLGLEESEELGDFCWLVASVVRGGSADRVAQESAIRWPYLFAAEYGAENFAKVERNLLLSTFEYPLGPSVAMRAVLDNFDDPSYFLERGSLLSSLIRSLKLEDRGERIFKALQSPSRREGFLFWRTEMGWERRALAYLSRLMYTNLSVVVSEEKPLAFVTASAGQDMNVHGLMSMASEGIESSLCGRENFVDVLLRSEDLEILLNRVAEMHQKDFRFPPLRRDELEGDEPP